VRWPLVLLIGLFAVYAPPNGGTPTAKTTTTVSRSASSTTTQQKEKQPAAARENGSRQKCGPPCGVKQSVGRVICQFKGDEQTKCCDNGPKITDWLMAAFAGLLVYVGARIGGRQLDLMSEQNAISREQNAITRRQADIQEGALRATAEAAQAANTNAITAVRPWLMARPDGPLEGWTFEWQETEGIRLLKVKWSIKNHGRSPGWVVSGTAVALRIVRRPPYPESPPYGDASEFVELVVGPGDTHTSEAICPISRADHEAIIRRDAVIMFVSKVVYRDSFQQTHVSRSAYEWFTPALMIGGQSYLVFGPAGPQSWTEYT